MRETRSSGSVEGVMSNRDPYSDSVPTAAGSNDGVVGEITTSLTTVVMTSAIRVQCLLEPSK